MKKLLIFIGLIIVPLIGFSQNMLIYNGEPGETVDQVARDSTVANAEDIATNTTAIEDTSVYTNYIYTKAEVDALINSVITLVYSDYSAWEDEYKAVFTEYGTYPSTATATLCNAFVKELKDSSYYSYTDALGLFMGESENNVLFNWIYPDSSFTLIDDPTYSTSGYTGDGTNDAINLNYNPSEFTGTNVSQNSMTVIIYAVADDDDGNEVLLGTNEATNDLYISHNGIAYANRINSDGSVAFNETALDGLYVVTRSASDYTEVFIDGVSQGSDVDASTGLINSNIWLLGRNDGSTGEFFSDDTIRFVMILKGLETWQVISLSTIINDFITDFDAL